MFPGKQMSSDYPPGTVLYNIPLHCLKQIGVSAVIIKKLWISMALLKKSSDSVGFRLLSSPPKSGIMWALTVVEQF